MGKEFASIKTGGNAIQEEITNKSVAFVVQTGKLTASIIQGMMQKYLTTLKQNGEVLSDIYKGKQSIKQLLKQNEGLSSIELADKSLRSFEKIARKYGVDYAVRKDNSKNPPLQYIFFKAKESDILTAAFREFTSKTLKTEKKHSILQALKNLQTKIPKEKEPIKDRKKGGLER